MLWLLDLQYKSSTMNTIKLFLAFLLSCCFFSVSPLIAQEPVIAWQNTIGGDNEDYTTELIETADNGFLVGGYSKSPASGDKSVAFGNYDYWLVKLDENGNIMWNKTYGGDLDDYLTTIEIANDGNYLIGGYSESGVSGNKTTLPRGERDYWFLKIDTEGNIIWQKSLGGDDDDELHAFFQTLDGGYFVGGSSVSHISGDKEEERVGYDYWIVRLDSSLNIIWQNTIQGDWDDKLRDAVQKNDSVYYLVGESTSGWGLDKTNDNEGWDDIWIVLINDIGLIYYDYSIGTVESDHPYSFRFLPSGGYLIDGEIFSHTEYNGTLAYWEYDPAYGETGLFPDTYEDENGCSVAIDSANNYFIVSGSNSPAGEYKTVDTIGGYDIWCFELNADHDCMWQFVLGGTGYDRAGKTLFTSDGGMVICGSSSSDISGNKTEDAIGPGYYVGGVHYNYGDYWIIKIFPPCMGGAEICNGLDDDCNGLTDDDIVESITINALGPTTFCQGGSVTLNATYSGTTIQWSKNGSPIAGATNATYTVYVKGIYTCETSSDCGTATSAPVNVHVLKNPPALITAGGPTTFCAGESVVLTANAGTGLTYQWYSGPVPVPGATNINYTATHESTYKCRVTKAATGCYKFSNGIIVDIVCKLSDDDDADPALQIYPNPAGQFITVYNTTSGNAILQLIGMNGDIIIEQPSTGASTLIDVHLLPAGIYLVKCIASDGTRSQLLVKN